MLTRNFGHIATGEFGIDVLRDARHLPMCYGTVTNDALRSLSTTSFTADKHENDG